MTTLALAIKFRALADQLSNTEFNTFITKLIQQCGRNILLTSLFNRFIITTNTNNFQQQTLTDIIAIIKNIMNAREIKKNAIITQNVSINALPSELIGEISSYLNQKKHITFAKMNRHIYIGSNNPNTLKHLDLEHITDYSSIHLRKYPQLQHLEINLNKFNELPAPPNGITVCNDISYLSLYAKESVDIDIDSFLSQKWLTFTNLKNLCLYDFGLSFRSQTFSFQTMHALMHKFPMIEHLSLISVCCDIASIDDNALYQLFPNLHKFSFLSAPSAIFHQFVNLYHNKLTFLALDDELSMEPSNTAHNFSDLRDLSILPTKQTINCILKTAINLQRIELNDDYDFPMSPNDWKYVMNKLISEQKSLKFLKITTKYTNVDEICCGLERALFKSDRTNRYFKINYKLIIKDCDKEQLDFEKLFLYISRIANELQSSNLTDFMLILKCEYRGIKLKKEIKKEWDKQKEIFKNKKSSQYAIYLDKFMIVVTNKQCTINGYSESCFYALTNK